MSATTPTGRTESPQKPLKRICSTCGASIGLKRRDAAFCSDSCRSRDWDRKHPRLEFLPTADAEEKHREIQRLAVLEALRQGPKTFAQLYPFGGPGTSGRLSELRKAGHQIKTERVGRHGLYVLSENPLDIPSPFPSSAFDVAVAAAKASEPPEHTKSVANPDWPYESRCTNCGDEWPCATIQIERRKAAAKASE